MNYEIGSYDGNYYKFHFDNGYYVQIDLAEDYPNYKLPKNKNIHNGIHYTIIENNQKNNFIDDKLKVGNVILFDKEKVVNYKPYPKSFTFNNIKYRYTTQYEYDKFNFKNGLDNDNSKLYRYIANIYNTYFNKIQETVII